MTNALDIVNDVLALLRDRRVNTISAPEEDVALIIRLVNSALEKVGNAHDWRSQYRETDIVTIPTTAQYALTDDKGRGIIEQINNITGKVVVRRVSRKHARERDMLTQPSSGTPVQYVTKGLDASGDTLYEFLPTPAEVQTIRFYWYDKVAPVFRTDTDTTTLPRQAVVDLAWAYASRERGETGGMSAEEIMAIANGTIRDAVALDIGTEDSEDDWYPE